MKKFFVTILAFAYLSSSTGTTVNLHYCMGKLMSWDLSHTQTAKCGSCGMEKKGHKGCCKDEQKIIKVDKDQKTSESVFQFHNHFSEAISLQYAELPVIYHSSIVSANPLSHGPPRLSGVPVFVLNCNFRI
jgi:hypothetical protein